MIVAFAGPIASGKSTLSTLVSSALGWPRASFGAYVGRAAETLGFGRSRRELQLAGRYLSSHDLKGFCEGVLRDASWEPGLNLVVEGIRHLEALETLRSLVAPSRLYLVYVSVGDTERERRFRACKGDNRMKLAELDIHPTEEQVKTVLFRRADIIVDNNRPRDKVADEIVAWIRSRQDTEASCP